MTRYCQVKTGGLFDRPVTLKALDGASFVIHRNQTLAVVGESGCGKSTLARVVTMIEPPTTGRFEIDGMDGTTKNKTLRQKPREQVQIVFQDPYGSLHPRKKVGSTLEEPLTINTNLSAAQRKQQALAMMAKVGLSEEQYRRYPHMFSGGQR